MSSERYYEVPPYKPCKVKAVAVILSVLHIVFVCIPVFLIVYVFVDLAFRFRDLIRFIKKTIKHAKAKLKPEPAEGLP